MVQRVEFFTSLEQLAPLALKPDLALLRQWATCQINLCERLQQQRDHLLCPGIPDLFVLLLVHIHQLADVVGVAQAVCALQSFVADQPVVHQHARDALEQAQGFKGLCPALGMRGQPGQGACDGAVQPVQFAFDANAGFIGVHNVGALHCLPDGRHRGAQRNSGVLGKALDAGLA